MKNPFIDICPDEFEAFEIFNAEKYLLTLQQNISTNRSGIRNICSCSPEPWEGLFDEKNR
jgi:hypothetical protein